MREQMSRIIFIIFSFFLFAGFYFFQPKSVFALSASIHMPEKYTEVVAGNRVYFEIQIKYPENPKRKDLKLTYEIIHKGEVIEHAEALKAIETQASFVDYITLPENAPQGKYTIEVHIDDPGSLYQNISTTFSVIESEQAKITLYFFILLGAIIVVGILVLIILVVK
jgi:hypothetical protein